MAKAFWLESMARRLAMAEASFPDTRARISPGTAMAASTPMMAQATSSSMRLNPDSLRALLAIVVSWQQSNRGPAARDPCSREPCLLNRGAGGRRARLHRRDRRGRVLVDRAAVREEPAGARAASALRVGIGGEA